jgi:hypothetical protein
MAGLPAPLSSLLSKEGDKNVGLLAEFPDPGALYDAVKAARKAGYSRLDTFTPFPIHGMDRAMGLGPSKLGFLSFAGALTGAALGYWLQWWTSAVEYPINISGKPLFALEPSVPIIFELTILMTALFTVGGMLAMNTLPKPYNPLFYSERFQRATDDAFFLQIGAGDTRFDQGETADWLYQAGALHVEYVDHQGATSVEPPAPARRRTQPAPPVA